VLVLGLHRERAVIRTTADRYTHLVPQVVTEALSTMDRTLLEAEGD